MKKLELKWRKLLRAAFGCISFTAVAFVFQACYGTKDMGYDVRLTGTVLSKTTHLPIKGIKVDVNCGRWYGDEYNFGLTDEKGNFDFYVWISDRDWYYDECDSVRYSPDSVRVHFLDIDGTENGLFNDTTIIINPAYKNEVKINVMLSEKQ